MKPFAKKLTLDRPATYEIRVPGELAPSWIAQAPHMEVAVERNHDALPITVLQGDFDQAALHSLLERLYARGVPLISVQCVACPPEKS